ncbi:UNVERIFIED_CONTAM: hypothetical protein Scaly_0992700 [Sesamum calycinum]|uniref:Reverse transcriptase domain-containing protein n=1 Tax=Sesamum calycinum TaxID=2727403 RepID=A0AAW2QZK6_9LAMI
MPSLETIPELRENVVGKSKEVNSIDINAPDRLHNDDNKPLEEADNNPICVICVFEPQHFFYNTRQGDTVWGDEEPQIPQAEDDEFFKAEERAAAMELFYDQDPYQMEAMKNFDDFLNCCSRRDLCGTTNLGGGTTSCLRDGHDECCRPDGFNALLYKPGILFMMTFSQQVLDFLASTPLSKEFHRNIYHPNLPRSRPQPFGMIFARISLCNTINKILTKLLNNQLKPWLPSLISSNQGGLVPSRLIGNDILLAHSIGAHHDDSSVALKLDMDKAYDRVDWIFFKQCWLDWVSRIIGYDLYLIVWNNAGFL